MTHRLLPWFRAVTLCMLVLGGRVSAAEWGDLKGRFEFGGTPPAPVPVKITKDTAVCSKHPLFDESLVVGKDKGVANIVIYVRTPDVPIHPDLEKSVPQTVVLDNKGCRFDPHIAPVWRGKQKFLLRNSDPVGHNSNVQPFGETGINPLIGTGKTVEYEFGRAQRLPVPVSCNLHPWMRAYVLPRDNPYVAVSGKDGSFTLPKLPAGELEFQVWQEKAGYVTTPAWQRGRFKFEIRPGVNDLGTITLDPAIFDKE